MGKSESNLNKQLVSLSPDVLVDLYEIDFSSLQPNFEILQDLYGITIGADSVYRFCPMINGSNPVYWQGKGYQPLPIKASGFEHKSDGRLPRPTLTIANPDGVLSQIVHSNSDFTNCKVTRKRTYVRFLDDENFQNRNLNESGKNPFGEADPNSHLPDDVYFINKKTQENKVGIEFELVSVLEFEDSWVPARIVLSSYCNWTYRCSVGCGYKGLPIEDGNGESLREGFAKNPSLSSVSGSDPVYDIGKVNPDSYPNGLIDIPDWNKEGRDSTDSGYKLNDLVKITPRNSNNPYKSTPQVFVCIQSHEIAKDHVPFFDKEYWAKDECQKTFEACKKRFGSSVSDELNNDYEKYVNSYSDLVTAFDSQATLNKYDWGKKHWEQNGRGEGRTMPQIEDIEDLSKYNKSNRTHKGLRFGGFPGTEKFRVE